MTAIDETDQRILTMLEADGRATLAQLAQASGLSVSAAQSRVQKLEKRGIKPDDYARTLIDLLGYFG